MTTTKQAVAQLLITAYRKAKRATRRKWKRHARPMTWRELRDLARVDYAAYLKTSHWQRVRRDALRRADYECQTCEIDRVQLEVHHLDYKRLGRERPRDLRVLCEKCHGEAHGR